MKKCTECSNQKSPFPNQGPCVWCNDTREVSSEVAEVLERIRIENLPAIVRECEQNAFTAKEAWKEFRKKKRPKGFNEVIWAQNRKAVEQRAKTTHADALKVRWEVMRIFQNPTSVSPTQFSMLKIRMNLGVIDEISA